MRPSIRARAIATSLFLFVFVFVFVFVCAGTPPAPAAPPVDDTPASGSTFGVSDLVKGLCLAAVVAMGECLTPAPVPNSNSGLVEKVEK